MLRRLILNLLLRLLGVSHEQPRPGDILITCPILDEPDTWWWVLLVWLFTGSIWTHAAICVEPGRVVEAIMGTVVREANLPTHYLLLRMNLTESERELLVRWARGRIGQPYSTMQFVAAGLKAGPLRRLSRHTRGYICTALVAEAYRQIGKPITSTGVPTPVEIVKSPVLQRA